MFKPQDWGPGLPVIVVDRQRQQQSQQMVGCQLWGLNEIFQNDPKFQLGQGSNP